MCDAGLVAAALAFAIRRKPARRKCTPVREVRLGCQLADSSRVTPQSSPELSGATTSKVPVEIDTRNLFLPSTRPPACRAVETLMLASMLLTSIAVSGAYLLRAVFGVSS